MPNLSMSIPHELGGEEATQRVTRLTEKINDQYKDQAKDVEQSWEGNTLTYSFRSMGMTFKGNVIVEDSEVKLSGDLPFAAMMFKGKIEKAVREQMTKTLA